MMNEWVDMLEMDMYLMLNCSLRYAITRHSYISSMASEWLLKYTPELTVEHRAAIIRELEMGIAQHHGQMQTIDSDIWEQTLSFLKTNVKAE